jgi:GT2 family glycosyltransferase
MTKVSTITPSYKSEKYLKGFLKNVKQQTHNNLEIILDHKEPTENEINIVKKFNSKNNNIKHLIADKVYPIGPSMNKCIENSTGEYLCIWNVDDLRTSNSIEVMAKALDEKKDVDIVIGKYIIVNKFKSKKGNIIDESKRSHSEFLRGMLLGPFFMFRKSLLSKIGKFDEQFFSGSDYDLAMRLVRAGNYFCLDETIGYYLNEGKGLSTKPDSLQPIERTAVELRYNLPVIDKSLIDIASKSYDLENLYYDSKKVPINQIISTFK